VRIIEHVREHRQAVVIIAVAVFVLLTAASGLVTSSVAVCSSCHTSQVNALEQSSHAENGCYSCHLKDGVWSLPGAKAAEWFRMYPAALLSDEIVVARPTSRQSCLQCHSAVLDAPVERYGLRVDHASCAPGDTCDTCHAGDAHPGVGIARGPVMEDCAACHLENSATIACDACHEGRTERDRLARGPWQVTHGPEWRSTHGMGAIDSCAICHQQDFCGKCHGVSLPHPAEFGRTHGASAIEDPAGCATCHKSTRFCEACHGMEMPHPAGYLASHSSDAIGVDDERCSRCHVQSECENCHARHIHPGGASGAPWLEGGVIDQ